MAHVSLWSGIALTLCGILGAAAAVVVGMGLIRKELLDALMKRVQAQDNLLRTQQAELEALKCEVKKLKSEGHLKAVQISLLVRVTEYLERALAVYVQAVRAGRIPDSLGDITESINGHLADLAAFRSDAELDLMSQETMQGHYEMLLTKYAISNKEELMPTQPTKEQSHE